VTGEPTASFEGVGKTVEFYHPDRGFRVDLFEQQVVGKVWITEGMHDRADEFWTGKRATAYVLADEDLFLLKAVSGGDLGAGRRRDIEDMRTYAQRGLAYEVILNEIEEQRPFNTGSIEATHIRTQSHPLFTIEVAVQSLSGLPSSLRIACRSSQPNSKLSTVSWKRSMGVFGVHARSANVFFRTSESSPLATRSGVCWDRSSRRKGNS